jgi:hypothetical protein
MAERAVTASHLAWLIGKPRCGDANDLAVKECQPFDQAGHFGVEQLRQADVKAKGVSESVFKNNACSIYIQHFAPAPANAASDSARRSRTASTVKREIGRLTLFLFAAK